MRDLVGLLYRADRTRLSLTAEVSITRDRDLWRRRFDDGPPPRPWSGGQFGLWAAPWFGPPRGLADEDPSVPWQSWESPDEAVPWGPRTSVIARQAAKEARSAVKSFLGVIRGEETR